MSVFKISVDSAQRVTFILRPKVYMHDHSRLSEISNDPESRTTISEGAV